VELDIKADCSNKRLLGVDRMDSHKSAQSMARDRELLARKLVKRGTVRQ
jgi:hypothetical protein